MGEYCFFGRKMGMNKRKLRKTEALLSVDLGGFRDILCV